MTEKVEPNKLNYRTRTVLKNCIYNLERGSTQYLNEAEKKHTEETLVMLKQLRDIGEMAGPSQSREEVAPGHWEDGIVDYSSMRLREAQGG